MKPVPLLAVLVLATMAMEHQDLLTELSTDQIELLAEADEDTLIPLADDLEIEHRASPAVGLDRIPTSSFHVDGLLSDGKVLPKRQVATPTVQHKTTELQEAAGVEDVAPAALTFVPPGGKIMDNTALKMIPANVNSRIFYTLDESDPSSSSSEYDPLNPQPISGKHRSTVTVKAVAVDDGATSQVFEASYEIEGSLGVQAHEEREKAENRAQQAQQKMGEASELAAKAVEKEEAANVISFNALKLIRKSVTSEAPGVEELQAKARKAKEDFFVALQTTKQLHERETTLIGQCELSDSKLQTAADSMLAANEDFDSADEKTRTVEWNGWVQKDKAECDFKREQSALNQAESWDQYTKACEKRCADQEEVCKADRDEADATATKTEQDAEEADEDNFFAREVKEAERREKEAIEAANAARAQEHEAKAAQKAAEAEAAVQEATEDTMELQMSEARQAVVEAQEAVNGASSAAAKALEHAEATKAAADRMREAMHKRGEAAVAALAALNAENHARNTVRELDLMHTRLRKQSEDARAVAEQLRTKRDDEQAVTEQARRQVAQVSEWLQKIKDELAAAQQHSDDSTRKLDDLQKQYDNMVEVERSAIDAVPVAERDSVECRGSQQEAEDALQKVKTARRKAWKAAYKAETGNALLKAARDKVAAIAQKEQAEADKKNADAQKMEEEQQAVVTSKQDLVATAEDMIAKAKAANDPDAEATAERSLEAAKSALSAAGSALKAAQTAVAAIKGSTASSLETVQRLTKAVEDLGTSDEAEQNAKGMAEKANDMMKTATLATRRTKELCEEARTEHKMRLRDEAEKTSERKRLNKELLAAKISLSRHGRYLLRKRDLVKEWTKILAESNGFLEEQEQKYQAATKAHEQEDAKVAELEAVTALQHKKLSAATQTVADSFDDLTAMAKTAGMDMVAKLAHMRAKWAAVVLEDATRGLSAAKLAVQQARPEVDRTTKAEEVARRARDKLQAMQDGMIGTAVSDRKAYKVIWITKTQLHESSNKENQSLHKQLVQAKQESKQRMELLETLEKTRRESALAALQLRVESVWKKRQQVHDPDPSRRLEISSYEQIIAAWDRDGTPVGPGVLDNWYLDTSKLTEPFEGKPGYLKEEVVNRCSVACAEVADLECSQGHRYRACTRGRVYRARFGRSATIHAKSDWFVCRCNTGVMQFASRDIMDVLRVKNKLLKATLMPENMLFDVRLHTEELLPDNHVHCFRDFESWLTNDTPFAEKKRSKFTELDALALSPPEEAKKSYEHVRQLWYDTCLREPPPELPKEGTHIGSTDGTFDLFEMKTQGFSTPDVSQAPDL